MHYRNGMDRNLWEGDGTELAETSANSWTNSLDIGGAKSFVGKRRHGTISGG